MRFRILHRTAYKYATPVRDSYNDVRLRPCTNQDQSVEQFELKVAPGSNASEYHDIFSNAVHHFEVFEPHDHLSFESRVIVKTHPRPGLGLDATPWPLSQIDEASRMARCYDFLHASRYVDTEPSTWRMAIDAIEPTTDAWQASLALMKFVHAHLRYHSGITNAHTHMSEALEKRAGVCQDFSHVLIGLCRSVRIPALYVSGYLATENASATHAWAEVYIPGVEWIGLDPTHNCLVNENYIKIAVGRDYADVPPVSGQYRGTRERLMEVAVEIERLNVR